MARSRGVLSAAFLVCGTSPETLVRLLGPLLFGGRDVHRALPEVDVSSNKCVVGAIHALSAFTSAPVRAGILTVIQAKTWRGQFAGPRAQNPQGTEVFVPKHTQHRK